MTRSRRRTVVAVLAASVLAMSVAGPTGGAAEPPAMTDGGWYGTIVYSAAGSFGGGVVSVQVVLTAGSFKADVDEGVVTGTFSVFGEGKSQLQGGGASLVASIDGTMSGTGAAPRLDPQSARFVGAARAGGITVPVDLTVGPDQMTFVPLTITAATCTQVNGNFVQPITAAVAGAGGSISSLTANFFAVRTKLSSAAIADLEVLMAEAQQVADNFAATKLLDAEALFKVIEKATALSGSLKSSKCAGAPGTGDFNTAVTGIIANMLQLAFTDPTGLTTDQLTDLLWWGTQVGAIGEGAIDQEFSEKLLADAKSVFAGRLNDAIAAGDKTEIFDIKVAAITMGWNDLAKQADAALKGSAP